MAEEVSILNCASYDLVQEGNNKQNPTCISMRLLQTLVQSELVNV